MLETHSLVLLPRSLGDRRYFVDPATGKPIGFVSDHELSWSARLVPGLIQTAGHEIHEMEGESLLCSYYLRRLPGYQWRVFDADDQLVGRLRPVANSRKTIDGGPVSLILNCAHSPHRLLGMLPVADAPGGMRMSMRDVSEPDWTGVGDVSRSEAGLLIKFLPALDQDPFAKMLLIVGVVVSFPERQEQSRSGNSP